KTPPFRPTSSPSTITRSSRAISSRRAERTASITVIVAIAIPPFSPPGPAPRSAGVHVPEDRFRRRIRRALGELGGVIDLALHAADRLFQQRVVQQPHLAQIVAEARERLALPPLLHLLARAIGAVVVIAGMRYQPVGLGFEEGRAIAAARPIDGALHRAVDGNEIVPIHDLAGHGVGAGAVGDIGNRHLLALWLRDGVAIVLTDEDDRQPMD